MLVVPTGLELRRRLPRLLPGLALCGVGLGLMVQAGLGLGPWEVLHQGISRRTGIPIGTVSIIVGVPVLLGWIPLRQRVGGGTVGAGTIVFAFGIGPLVQHFLGWLTLTAPAE